MSKRFLISFLITVLLGAALYEEMVKDPYRELKPFVYLLAILYALTYYLLYPIIEGSYRGLKSSFKRGKAYLMWIFGGTKPS